MKFEKLGNIVTITSGGTPLKSKSEYYLNGKIPWVKTGDLKVKELIKINDFITESGLNNSSAKLFPINTVLVAMYGATIGACSIMKIEATTNQACAALLPSEKINHEYLYYYIHSIKQKLINQGVGGGQPNISATILKNTSIWLPNKETQLHIANILTKAESLIAQRKESIRLLDEYLKSVFLEMFGDPVSNNKNWTTEKLSKLGTLDRGVSKNRPRNAPELLGGEYPLIQTGDIANSGLFIERYNQTYSEIGLKQSKMWPSGTLCITIAANIGKASILKFDACFPDSVVGFVTNQSKCETIFVYYLFRFLQSILEKNAPQAAQKNINLGILRELPVPNPPLELQTKFAQIVEKTEALKAQYQQSLQELENLYGSLSQKAFKGELTLSER